MERCCCFLHQIKVCLFVTLKNGYSLTLQPLRFPLYLYNYFPCATHQLGLEQIGTPLPSIVSKCVGKFFSNLVPYFSHFCCHFFKKMESKFPFVITPLYCLQDSLKQKEIPFIDKGGSESVHWYVRGDKAGRYNVDVRLQGMIMPFEEPIDDKFICENQINVYAGNAMHLHFEFPDGGYRYHPDLPQPRPGSQARRRREGITPLPRRNLLCCFS